APRCALPPAFCHGAYTAAGVITQEGGPPNREYYGQGGGGGPPLDLFPAPAPARGLAAAHAGAPPYLRSHLRHVRPFARSCRLLRHRDGTQARRTTASLRARRQSPALLPPSARQRRLRRLRGCSAAGSAQSGILSPAEYSHADAARGA